MHGDSLGLVAKANADQKELTISAYSEETQYKTADTGQLDPYYIHTYGSFLGTQSSSWRNILLYIQYMTAATGHSSRLGINYAPTSRNHGTKTSFRLGSEVPPAASQL